MNASKWFVRVTGLLAALAAQAAFADSCALDPTHGGGGMDATSRFGIIRSVATGGNYNGGHGGQDLRAEVGTKLYAPFDGTVLYRTASVTGGNMLAIKNANGDVVRMMHLSGFADGVVKDKTVTAGQFVATSGSTGKGTGPHLHLEYSVKRQDDVRNAWVEKGMTREQVFKAQNHFKPKGDGTYITDPAGYMCDAYTFVKDAAKDNAVLGKTTKEQYQILYGSVPNGTPPSPSSEYTDAQANAANSVAVQANANGKTVTEFLSNNDGYGALPGARYDSYENISPSEMLAREAKRRMFDADWQQNLTKISSRALWVDYLQILAASNYMQEAIYRKREKVEGLLAVIVAQQADDQRKLVDAARNRAVQQAATAALK